MTPDASTLPELDLEGLKQRISPEEIAYFSEGGATGTRAREACQILRTIENPTVLRDLLEHSKTLRAPHGKEFPIGRIRSVIIERLEELKV